MSLSRSILFLFFICFISSSFSQYTNLRDVPIITELRTIPAGSMDSYSTEAPSYIQNLPFSVAMIGFTVDFLDENGQPIESQNRLYLHHLLINEKQQNELACPEYGEWGVVAGAGAELTNITLPYPYAYLIEENSNWNVAIDVMNPSTTQNITYSIRYTFQIADWTGDLVRVQGYFNSITGCKGGDLEFDVNQSAIHQDCYLYLDFPMSVTGKLIWMTGHLHRGGKNIYLLRRDTGEVIFNAAAHYDDPTNSNYLTAIDSGIVMKNLTIHQPFRVSAIYDCTQRHKGVMAIVFGYVVVEELYSGNPPLAQISGNINPFPLYPNVDDVKDDSDSQTNNGVTEEVGADTDALVFGLVAAIGFGFIFFVVVIVVVVVFLIARMQKIRAAETIE